MTSAAARLSILWAVTISLLILTTTSTMRRFPRADGQLKLEGEKRQEQEFKFLTI